MAENMIKFLRGSVANLPQTATAGAVYFTKDEGLYLGLEDGSYHRYGDFITVADVASLPEAGAHETCMYYCESENILAKWDGSAWVQINKQKTLAELGGVAKSVYEAKMTALEKADTDNATAIAGVDTRLQAAEEKLKSVATTEGLGELTDRVKTAEDEIDALQADSHTHGNKTVLDGITAEKVAAWDAAEGNAKAHADGLDSAMNTRVAALEAAIGEEGSVAEQIEDAVAAETEAREAAIEGVQGEIDALELVVGTPAEGKTIVEMIADAQTAATYNDAEVRGLISDNADAIDAIEADYLKAADKTELSDAIAAEAERADLAEKANAAAIKAISDDYLKAADKTALQEQITANASAIELLTNGVSAEEVDGVNDLIQYVKDHGTEVTGMKADIAANAKAIADQATADAAAYETKTDAAAKLTEAKEYAEGLDEAMDTRVKVLEAINHEAYIAADETVLASAKAHADGLDAAMNTRVAALEAIDHEHANKAELDLIASGDKAKWDEAAGKAHTHSFVESELNLIHAGDVAKWNAAQANAEATAAGALASAKTELEGKISAAETAAKGHADTEVGKVQTALDEYKIANNAAVALKANAADVYTKSEVYAKTETYNKDEIDALLTWGSF